MLNKKLSKLQKSALSKLDATLEHIPSYLFNKDYYLEMNPDVKDSGMNPICHYRVYGWKEARNPSIFFNTLDYISEHVLSENDDPLSHCLKNNLVENVILKHFFDEEYYLLTYPDIKKEGKGAFQHFIYSGWREGKNPNYYFQTLNYKIINNLDDSINPFFHYIVEKLKNIPYQNKLSQIRNDVVIESVNHYVYDLDEPTQKHSQDSELIKFLSVDKKETVLVQYKKINPNLPTVLLVLYCHEHRLSYIQDKLCNLYLKKINCNLVLILNQPKRIKSEFLNIPEGLTCLITRENINFDFGAWYEAIHLIPGILTSRRVIFTNDSLIPIEHENSFIYFFEQHINSNYEWLFTTKNYEFEPHGQSYFMSCNPKIDKINLKFLFVSKFNTNNKGKIINQIEIPLYKKLKYLNIKVGFLYDKKDYSKSWGKNPTLSSFKELLNSDFPFVKLECFVNEINKNIEFFNHYFSEIDYFFILNQINARFSKNNIAFQNFPPSGNQFFNTKKIILWGHNAEIGGAQILFYNLANSLKNIFNYEIVIILSHGGKNLNLFQQLGYCITSNDRNFLTNFIHALKADGFNSCIINTVVPLNYVDILNANDISSICLVHELPNMIDRLGRKEVTTNAFKVLDAVIFPHENVMEKVTTFLDFHPQKYYIYNQGHFRLSRVWQNNIDSHEIQILEKIKLLKNKNSQNKIVLSVGTIEKRKGFDTYIQLANYFNDKNIIFIWVGTCGSDLEYYYYLAKNMQNVILIDYLSPQALAEIYQLSDVYFFASREDPMPYSVIDAFWFNIPVIGFSNVGGLDILLKEYGYVIESRSNYNEIKNAVLTVLQTDSDKIKKAYDFIKNNFDFDDYVHKILNVFGHFNPKISVIFISYNHEKYLPVRVRSVLWQTYKYFNIIFLDDNSSDGSCNIFKKMTKDFEKYTKFHLNTINSGNSYSQWTKGVEIAQDELLWIVETDDFCDKNFLSNMIHYFENPEVTLAYSHTNFVNENGKVFGMMSDGFKHIHSYLWNTSYVVDGRFEVSRALSFANTIINVSSVLFRTSHIKDLIHVTLDYKFAGDWCLYLNMAKKGKVAFSRNASNYFRRSENSQTSSVVYSELFYEEHAKIAKCMSYLYDEKNANHVKKLIEYYWNIKPLPEKKLISYLNYESDHSSIEILE